MPSGNSIASLSKKIDDLVELVNHLYQEIKDLKRENAQLKEKLAKYEHPKNSNNSSIPPSKDENRPFKSKSLRKKTGRKPGGQKGREGKTLQMVSNPDKFVDHSPDYCECCGLDLGSQPGKLIGRRQEIDIPPIKPVYTEEIAFLKVLIIPSMLKYWADCPQTKFHPADVHTDL